VVTQKPTAAEAADAAISPESDLRGPKLPDSTKESLMGPEKPERAAAPGTVEAGAPEPDVMPTQPPGIGLPGDALPGLPTLPGIEQQPPAGQPDPGAPGAEDDPFSVLPPAPPWMVAPAQATAAHPASNRDGQVAPAVDYELKEGAPADPTPNLNSDDAPPPLPAALLDELAGVPRRQPVHFQAPVAAAAPVAGGTPVDGGAAGVSTPALPSGPFAATPESAPALGTLALPPESPAIQLSQPKSIAAAPAATAAAPPRGIVPASASAAPQQVQLISPAVAVVEDLAEQSTEAAVYFEASDLPSTPAVRFAAPQ